MVAAVAVVLGVRVARSPRPLTYAVGQGAAEQDGYIRGVGAAGSNVRFSDGTRIDLAQGARLSVLARGGDGARLRVEDGEAHFEVVHRPRAAWSVEAGPFVVYVTGTSFDVRWSGSQETAEVRLRSGSVRVAGPFLPEKVTLRPGQRLIARLANGELRIEESHPIAPPVASDPTRGHLPAGAGAPDLPEAAASAVVDPLVAPAVDPPVAPAVAPEEPPSVATNARASSASAPRGPAVRLALPHRLRSRRIASSKEARFAPASWLSAVAAGVGAEVVAQAEAHGIEATLGEVDAGALAALADAARYGGRRDLATRALLAERSRFPGTPPAQVAAFLLGRLADDRGETKQALDWYRRYLGETPRGPYAAEALGREMLTIERLYGRPAARPMAVEYVRRFSNGTYLLQAHSILANP
jgi:hypothetical protein